jgi:hemerythrin superfamily protein
MATDAVTLIMNDHRVIEELLARLGADEGDRQALVAEVAARLAAHARAEEQEVYPALVDAQPVEEDEVDHAYHEHRDAEHELRKVRNLIASPHFTEAVAAFVAAVNHHVQEEEAEVLPQLREAVDAPTLEHLGTAFARARAHHLAQTGFAAPDDADQSAQGSGATNEGREQLEQATRDELYKMARQADISGRSSMTKNQLAKALRDQA